MRRLIKRLTLVVAALMIVAVPALADEGSMDRRMEQGQLLERNECLLVAVNCANEVDSIYQRIDRIKREISRGTDVYTTDELRKLDRLLDEANKTVEVLGNG